MAEVSEARGPQRPLHHRGRGVVVSPEAGARSLKLEAGITVNYVEFNH